MNMNKVEVKAFKQEYCEELHDIADVDSSIYENTTKFEFKQEFASGSTGIFLDIDVISKLDQSLGYKDKGVNICDITNSKLVYEALFFENNGTKRYLTPLEASDRRIWTYLSHSYFFNYMQKRWGLGDLSKRYFMPGKRSQLRFEYLVRHGISRLWWMAYLTYDLYNEKDPFHLLPILMKSTDVAVSLIERRISHSRKLLQAHLLVIESDLRYQKEYIHRETVKKVLAESGIVELAMLNEEELKTKIRELADSNFND